MALLEANRSLSTVGISQWTFDDAIGRISARDIYGNLIMAFAAGPLFGPRLAAAFGLPAMPGVVFGDLGQPIAWTR